MSWRMAVVRGVGGLSRRWRALLLIAAAILSGVAMVEAPSIETSADPTAYLPRSRPEVAAWLDLNERFGALDLLIVGLEEPEEPLSPPGLEALAGLTRRLEDLKARGVLSARSLTNVDTVTPDEAGTLHAGRLVPTLPSTPEERDALMQRVLADTQVPGSLVSRDLRAYLILVRPDPRKDNREVARLVEDVVEAGRGPLTAHFFGGPFIANVVTRKVYDRLPWLVPLFAGLLLGVLALGTRGLGAGVRTRAFVVATVLGCAGLSLVWWLGLLRVFGLSLTMSDVNGLLLVLAVATLLYARFADARLSGATSPPGVLVAFSAACGLALAVLCVAGPLLPAPLPFLGRMGALLAVGFAAVLGLGFLGVWPLLTYVGPTTVGLLHPPTPGRDIPESRAPSRAVRLGALVLLVAASIAAFQVRFVFGLRDLFTRSDDVGATLAFFDRRFGGSDFLQVSARGDLRDPAVLARLHRLSDLIEGSGAFADVRSITQVVGFLAQHFGGAFRVPDDRESLNTLWFLLDGNDDVRALVTPARDEAMLALRVPPGRDPGELVAVVEEAVRDSEDPGPSGAARRLDALARLAGVNLPPGWSTEVVTRLTAASPAAVDDEALALLRRELSSPESPFLPTADEFEAIAGTLKDPGHGRSLEDVLRSLPSFQALDAPPDWPGRIARMIRDRAATLNAEVRAGRAVDQWRSRVPSDRATEALTARARGIALDAIAGPRAPGAGVSFLVTGFPVLVPVLERDLWSGLFRALAGVVTAVFLAGWVVARRVRPPVAVLVRAALAGLAPLGIASVTGLQVDFGSATMVLVGPVAAGLLSVGPAGTQRRPLAQAMPPALAAACASLAVTGVLPVVRIGLLLGLALVCGRLVTLRETGVPEPAPAPEEAA